MIDEESDRLNRFIEGLSTPQARDGVQPPHLGAVPLDDILRAGLARAETVTRDHRVVVALAGELPPLSVDPPQSPKSSTSCSTTRANTRRREPRSRSRLSAKASTTCASRSSTKARAFRLRWRERVFEKFFRMPARESHDPRANGDRPRAADRAAPRRGAGRTHLDRASDAAPSGTTVVMTLPVAAGRHRTADLLRAAAASR